MEPLLEVRDLNVRFGAVEAVRDVSFTIAPGESLGLVGESGSGKSVTSLAMMRLLVPLATVSGSIRYATEDLLNLPEDQMRALRGARISMIFQEPMAALNPVMRIGDQISEAVRAHFESDQNASFELNSRELRNVWLFNPLLWIGDRLIERIASKSIDWIDSKTVISNRVLEAMREVAIPEPERRAREYPHQLSGGMRQRVMIAMALVNRPQLLIADEPTTALDVTIQAQILELLRELRRKHNLAMLFISHDLGVVSQIVDRIAVMYGGRILEMGSVKQVFTDPRHPYTRGLLDAVPSLRSDRSGPLRTITPAQAWMSAAPQPLVEVEAGHWARPIA